MKKEVLFLTATRADFGKLKPLMRAVDDLPDYKCSIFVTGMHTLNRYGLTGREVDKVGFKHTYRFINQFQGEPMDLVLANTISGLSRYIHENRPDLIVVHGDRLEALAGAISGAFNNILVAHIEGGEISGTIDELIRHSVTKLSHIHFVANDEAARRLVQLGEEPSSIFIIGSPDIDVMLSNELPSLHEVKRRYDISFADYAILIFHPVTTEVDCLREQAEQVVDAVLESDNNYVVIYPNNDLGSDQILAAYDRLKNQTRFRIFPSLRFEYFLTLLKNAQFIIGNSSAGIREAPVYGIPTLNIGTRQEGRFRYKSIFDVDTDKSKILYGIKSLQASRRFEPCLTFGKGESANLFIKALKEGEIWNIPKQKQFRDVIP